MPNKTLDVIAIGNAIVDVLAPATDETLATLALQKGGMQLIEERDIARLYDAMGRAQERSGGSAANTVAGLASLGSAAHFIGRVADDDFGRIFAHDLRAAGVAFASPPAPKGSDPTARCLIFVTPDGERTMNTYLGCSPELDEAEISADQIAAAKVLYLEGYLYDRDAAKRALHLACDHARDAGTRVALSLSDTFCVERHRNALTELIASHVDILFANEDEIRALVQTDDATAAARSLATDQRVIVMTRGPRGSLICHGEEFEEILPRAVEEVVDTTGAGDLYAAGFLHGHVQGLKFRACGEIGSIAAAEVISHMGARPEQSLSELVSSLKT
ncbi:MAG: adenosine kinase [Pseudomonadota bacterium]